MAKKKAQQTAPVMTRGQLSRAERERRQVRNLYTAVIGVVSLAALLVLLVALNSFVLRPNETLATVNGVNINRAAYQKLRRYNVFQAKQQQSLMGQLGQTGQSIDQNALADLTTLDNETTIDEGTLNQLVDSEVARQYAKSDPQMGVTASLDDLRADARKSYLPSPTPPTTPAPPASETTATVAASAITGTATITPTNTLTPTPGSPTLTSTPTQTWPPVPGAEQTAEAVYTRVIASLSKSTAPQAGDPICPEGCPNISEEDYLHLVVEPQFLQTKVSEKLVLTDTEQIRAQHILTDTEEGAKKLLDMLNKHGADPDSKYFTQIANEFSSEQTSKAPEARNGGDLGWFAEKYSNYVPEFVNGAWSVKAGEYTKAPVKSQFGWHIIKVLERDPKRARSESELSTARSQAYQSWIDAKRQESKISSKVPTSTPVVTPTAVQEPTKAPVVAMPTTGAVATPPKGSPAASPPASTPAATPTK